jgi:cytochrome c553
MRSIAEAASIARTRLKAPSNGPIVPAMARHPRFGRGFAPLALLVALAFGCSKSEGTDNAPAPPSPAPVVTAAGAVDTNGGGGSPAEAQAVTIFKARCSTCHGMDGKGNGAAAITLNPKPRNYTDPAWQKSVTDDHIREIIVKGGAAVGKSPNMLANPDLADKPDVVDALVKKVRSFAPQGAVAAAADGGK